ncbi:MAG: BamA/TamA family outer membrane protein [Bacteroidia bacterium]
MYFRFAVFFTFIYISSSSLFSQESGTILTNRYTLQLNCIDSALFFTKISYAHFFDTPVEREKELQLVLLKCIDNAYLAATIDSVYSDSLLMKAYIYVGQQYRWATLKNGNVDEAVLSELGFRDKLYKNKPITFKNIKHIQEKILTYYENNGYPFAEIKLDSIVINGSTISAQLFVNKNKKQQIDSVIVRGNSKISPIYLYSYLSVKPGDLYDESVLKKVNTRIAELSFVKLTKPSAVVFNDKYNKLILNLDKKQASQFDGIVGVLPDNNTGKILFTGDVRLRLQNGLGKGELIDLNWRKLQTQTQDLKLRTIYPFAFNTPFGIDYNFKLYKRDTTFLDVNQNIGLQYLFSGGNYFKLFYANKNASLLSTKGLEYVTTLPLNADISSNMYGIGWMYEKMDYRLNPRKGYFINSNISVGTKKIKKNTNLNPIVYDNIRLNTTQYMADIEGAMFVSVMQRSTVKFGVQGGFLYNQTIFQNELFRIGGLKTLRGFDEESINSSVFSILTIEYRFLLEENSYLYVFGDGAYYENHALGNFIHDTPFGVGAGISFETKAGIFSINYALGRQFDNPLELKGGKIHFGIVNSF